MVWDTAPCPIERDKTFERNMSPPCLGLKASQASSFMRTELRDFIYFQERNKFFFVQNFKSLERSRNFHLIY
jgi:hypothetical protein